MGREEDEQLQTPISLTEAQLPSPPAASVRPAIVAASRTNEDQESKKMPIEEVKGVPVAKGSKGGDGADQAHTIVDAQICLNENYGYTPLPTSNPFSNKRVCYNLS
jgi:hypothetical protein